MSEYEQRSTSESSASDEILSNRMSLMDSLTGSKNDSLALDFKVRDDVIVLLNECTSLLYSTGSFDDFSDFHDRKRLASKSQCIVFDILGSPVAKKKRIVHEKRSPNDQPSLVLTDRLKVKLLNNLIMNYTAMVLREDDEDKSVHLIKENNSIVMDLMELPVFWINSNDSDSIQLNNTKTLDPPRPSIDGYTEVIHLFKVRNVKIMLEQNFAGRVYGQFKMNDLLWVVSVFHVERHLDMLLRCISTNDRQETWSCKTRFSFRILTNRPETATDHVRRYRHEFTNDESRHYCSDFISSNDLENPFNGYIEEDTLNIQIRLLAQEPVFF